MKNVHKMLAVSQKIYLNNILIRAFKPQKNN